jgi:uroporphyrinogen decarboxylase
MLPIERVFNRLQGKPTDRVPFAPLTSLYGARLTSCPLDQYYTNPTSYFQGQKAIVDEFEPDILFSPFALVMEAEAFGSKAAYFEKNPPNLKIPGVSGFEEIKNLTAPEIKNNPRLVYLIESTRLLVEHYKNQIPVAAIVNSPTELPAMIMGIENWIDTLLFHPFEAQQMINLCSEYFVSFANIMLSLGAACIITPASFSNPTIITKHIAETVMVPEMHKVYARVNGPIVFHHGGARLIPFLDLLHNLPNVVGFVLDPRDSFDEAREIIGNDLTVMGNLNGQLLLKANPKIIESWTIKLLENRVNDRKYIMTTSNADIPYDTPIENINIIASTIKKFNVAN